MSGCLQQGQQAASTIERDQIITATHMLIANENLRHSAPACERHHAASLFGELVDADLFNVLDAPRFQELFSPNAIRANCGGEHLDGWHGIGRYSLFNSSFFKWKIGILPNFQSPAQAVGLFKALGFGHANRFLRTHATGTHQNERAFFVRDAFTQIGLQFVHRDVFGTNQMARGEFFRTANINDVGFFAVHQQHGLGGRQARSAEILQIGQQQGHTRCDGYKNEQPVFE